jgi:hypothetical protein
VILRSHNGHDIILDNEDFAWANQWIWCSYVNACGRCYVRRCKRIDGIPTTIWLAREVALRMGLSISGVEIDHVSGDPLDNRRVNLRLATSSENCSNRKKRLPVKGASATSNFIGVSWIQGAKKWRVQVRKEGKSLYSKYFSDEIEAAHAYDVAAKSILGNFARLNFNNGEPTDFSHTEFAPEGGGL